jgi:hypothetical protein
VAVSIWNGDLARAEREVATLVTHAKRHSLGPYGAVAHGRRGQLSIRHGRAEDGIRTLKEALASLDRARFQGLTTIFKIELASGLRDMEHYSEALEILDLTSSWRNPTAIFCTYRSCSA